MEVLKTIPLSDGVNFNLYPGPIGLLCSGGADSSLMMYFALRFYKGMGTLHIFDLANNPLGLKNTVAVTKALNKNVELTGNHDVQLHIIHMDGDKPDGPEILGDMIKQVGVDINVVMTGVTKNPPKEVLDTFTDEYECSKDPNRDEPNLAEQLYDATDEGYPWVYTPWSLIDKQGLGDLYKKYDLMDSLFPLTYSCEYYPRDKVYADPGDKHCGKCWWCQEREWAFGRL